MIKHNEIRIIKSNVHNLKNVSLTIPKNTLCVFTGPSGSGKSSLAFDTIYVEGQRRYIESLSSYARQFLGQFEAPDVESITGLSPAIAIDQKSGSRSPRSTVGTITEIYDYMRILFSKIGTLHCPETKEIIRKYTIPQISRIILDYKEGSKLLIMSPISLEKSHLQAELERLQGMGFARVRINKQIYFIEDVPNNCKCSLFELIIDRLVIRKGINKRLSDSLDQAIKISKGVTNILIEEEELTFSEYNKAPSSGLSYPDLGPRSFSFNNPIGACSCCKGLGESKVFKIEALIFDESVALLEGAIPIISKTSFLGKMIQSIAIKEEVDLKLPLKDLPLFFKNILYEGTSTIYNYKFISERSHFEFSKDFSGIIKWLEKKYHDTKSEAKRKSLETYMIIDTCSSCLGKRLNPLALNTTINDINIIDLSAKTIGELSSFFKEIRLSKIQKKIVAKLLEEISSRIHFLQNVGLDYLSLARSASSLSGGEGQRIRLATQIGSSLSGVLYVLDEPSIGLHQRDNLKLIKTLKKLRDIGNTVIVVEHDEETIREADFIVDIGPGAGIHGGNIICSGPIETILKNPISNTAVYLRKEKQISIPLHHKDLSKKIHLTGAKENNLKNIDISFPLEGLTCITGVSGSGKSTLVHQVLIPALKSYIDKKSTLYGPRANYQAISGVQDIKGVIQLDQSPIGRTPKSNPATYTGIFDEIRTIFSNTSDAKIRGYKAGRFSFNIKGGRCDECEGNGLKKIEMHFLPDIFIECDECRGTRYNEETLNILYKGKNINDVLEMSIEEAFRFFKNFPKISRTLKILNDIGLGYVKMGQPATTLSGGEAQRLKLSRELSKKTKGKSLYILDEPTTGLHFSDIDLLLKSIYQLIKNGHSVLVIEHNLDVIKCADHIIDLGPEGGIAGGEVIFSGPPNEIIHCPRSYTGQYLRPYIL